MCIFRSVRLTPIDQEHTPERRRQISWPSQPCSNLLCHLIITRIFNFFFLKTYVYGCFAVVPAEARRGFRDPWAGVMEGWEPPHGCWDLSLGPLEER